MKLAQFVLESSTSIENRMREHYKEENRPTLSWGFRLLVARVARLAKVTAEMLLNRARLLTLAGSYSMESSAG